MEIRRLDVSQILLSEEKVELKVQRKTSKMGFLPTAICYLFFLLCLTGDCFFIGALIPMKEIMKEQAVNNILLPLAIILTVLHVVPFIFWFVFTLQNKAKNEGKWYLLTNKRVCIVSFTKTLSVVSVFFNQITAMKIAKSAVYLTVGEEKIVIDGLEPYSSFSSTLENLLTGEEYNANLQTEITPVKDIEDEAQTILQNQSEKVEQSTKPNDGSENLTKQIDQMLQEFADKVLNSDQKEECENTTEENKQDSNG